MPRKTGLTRRAALGLAASGTFLTVSETFGFSNAMGTRAVGVGVEDDPNALLGVEGVTDTSVTPTFTNNSGRSMDVTLDSPDDIELDIGDNGNWTAPPVSFSLAVGASETVNIRFVGECTGAGTAVLNANASLLDGSGTEIGRISLSRDVQIPESGQAQFSGTASSAGSSGKYEFEIENTGCADVTFVGIGINETTTDADYVSGGGSLNNVDTGDELVTDSIPIDSSDPTSDTRRDMNPTVTLPQNQTVAFEFDKFQRNGPGKPNVDMRGQDIRITLYLSDGSSATEKLCLGTCDF